MGDGELLLWPEAQPGLGDDPGAVALGQGLRTIGAAGVDNDDVIGKMCALQAFLKLCSGIEGDDRNGERLTRGWHL